MKTVLAAFLSLIALSGCTFFAFAQKTDYAFDEKTATVARSPDDRAAVGCR